MSDIALYERPGGPNAHSRQLFERGAARHLISPFSSTRSLSSLPYDILLNVAELFDPDEIVALGQTSKSLRDFSRTRSIWLRLAANMLDMCQPLPVHGFQRLWELNTLVLSRVIRHGFRLQRSWSFHNPKMITPYKVIAAPESENIVWLSPITSKYTLCCTKKGKVLCWDVQRSACVAEWRSGDDWEIWKCRVEFDERIVYFAMAKRVPSGTGTDCQLMALTFPAEVNGILPSSPTFTQLSVFKFPGHVISVYLLDPLRRLLSAYIWIEASNNLGLYVLLDWKVPVYTFLDTGISCEPLREWSCIGYDPANLVIHAEEKDHALQFFYPLTLLQSLGSLTPPPATPPRVDPPRTLTLPFLPPHPRYTAYAPQSAHFVRQWWPTLPHAAAIRRRSCTIILLTFRVPDPAQPGDAEDGVENPPPAQQYHHPPGTHLFTIAQHYFSIPLETEQLRWWYVREPFEIVCFPHFPLPAAAGVAQGGEDAAGQGAVLEEVEEAAGTEAPAPAPEHIVIYPVGPAAAVGEQEQAAVPVAPPEPVEDPENMHVIPLIAVDFGCAVWLEYVRVGSDEKRLRFVTFPPVDADRGSEAFDCLSAVTQVRTLDVPAELDLSKVCHIGIDQAQGTIILGLCTGKVYIMRYE